MAILADYADSLSPKRLQITLLAPCIVYDRLVTAFDVRTTAHRSVLAELCQSTSMEFSGDPPLFSKPPGWTPDLMAATHEPPPPPPPRPSYSPPPQLEPPMEEFQQNPLNPSPSRCDLLLVPSAPARQGVAKL